MASSAPAPAEDVEAKLEHLRDQHRQAEERLRELERQDWLSPEEQAELSRLKKEKLRLKDEMRNLTSRSGS